MCEDGSCKTESAMSVKVETAAAECAAHLESVLNKFNESHRLKVLHTDVKFVYTDDEGGALGALTIEAKDDVVAKAIAPVAGQLTSALLKAAMARAEKDTGSKSRTLN